MSLITGYGCHPLHPMKHTVLRSGEQGSHVHPWVYTEERGAADKGGFSGESAGQTELLSPTLDLQKTGLSAAHTVCTVAAHPATVNTLRGRVLMDQPHAGSQRDFVTTFLALGPERAS